MNPYPSMKSGYALAFLWAVGSVFWVAAADPVQTIDHRQQIALKSSAVSEASNYQATEGCPYPPEAPAMQGSANNGSVPFELLPELVPELAPEFTPEYVPELGPSSNGPVRPAVFQEVTFPSDANEPLIIRI